MIYSYAVCVAGVFTIVFPQYCTEGHFFLTVLYENYAVPMHKYSAVGLEGHFLIYLFVFLKLSVLRYDLHV